MHGITYTIFYTKQLRTKSHSWLAGTPNPAKGNDAAAPMDKNAGRKKAAGEKLLGRRTPSWAVHACAARAVKNKKFLFF